MLKDISFHSYETSQLRSCKFSLKNNFVHHTVMYLTNIITFIIKAEEDE